MGSHHLCDTVKERTAAMSEEEANVYFCREMPERKEILDCELPAVDTGPVLPGHKMMCERYMRSLKKGKRKQSWQEKSQSFEDSGGKF